MGYQPGSFFIIKPGSIIPTYGYEQMDDEMWTPIHSLAANETLFVLLMVQGSVQDDTWKPPVYDTTMYRVISSWHGITHVCEEILELCCELVGDVEDESRKRNIPQVR